MSAAADAIEQTNRGILRVLRGDRELQKLQEPVPSSINDRVEIILEGERFALTKPTQTHIDDYNIAAGEFAGELAMALGTQAGRFFFRKRSNASSRPATSPAFTSARRRRPARATCKCQRKNRLNLERHVQFVQTRRHLVDAPLPDRSGTARFR